MLERQREGIARAKREGRYKGRVPTARRQADEIIRLRDMGVRPSEMASRLGIGRASVYRVLGEQTADERQEPPSSTAILSRSPSVGTASRAERLQQVQRHTDRQI